MTYILESTWLFLNSTCTYLERIDEYMYLAGSKHYTLSASRHLKNQENARCCVALKADVRIY